MTAPTSTATLGYPRIGRNREIKKGLESYWSGVIESAALLEISSAVQADALRTQLAAGIDRIAVGDHTMYDHVLDWTTRFGAIPPRYANVAPGLPTYFAMARGVVGATALDMSKFFDTNYHYLVPEIDDKTTITPDFSDFMTLLSDAQKIVGMEKAVPNVLGPVTYVRIATLNGISRKEILVKLIPAYEKLLAELKAAGVSEVQIQEPALVLGDADELKELYEIAFAALAKCGVPIHIVTYFDDVAPAVFEWASKLPGLNAFSLDFTRGDNLSTLKKVTFPTGLRLGAGVVDGRSPWADVDTAAPMLKEIREKVGSGVSISVQPSCSLQYVPIDVEVETMIPADVKKKLAFAVQKLDNLTALAGGASGDGAAAATQSTVQVTGTIAEELFKRKESFEERRPTQFTVPGGFGTTSIGSFPPAVETRRLRTKFKKGEVSKEEYFGNVDKEIAYAIGMQEALGLDVLVHGEPERSDMVEYFGVKLKGMTFSTKGWVQSYGSRYVRPPIIYGDVTRLAPMTIREFKVAQAMTSKPVKGMLTAATTILNWSFPRKDVSREEQAYQIGLALREEVQDLEAAGCRVIQVDDPALREGLPLKQKNWAEYLRWAVRAFRLSTSGVKPSTQIVTHLCYADFEDILPAIDDMNADVLTIENSRSGDEMLRQLAAFGYSRDVGPGVYDIHSPVIPKTKTMTERVELFMECGLKREQLWVNPDCGLKTRKWPEVMPALRNMVEAAQAVRGDVAA